MTKKMLGLALGAALIAAPAFAADKLKIGFMATLSGPPAAIGQHVHDGFMLAVEELGGKLGGLPTEVLKQDDQLKPDVGVQIVNDFIKRDQVHLITGMIFSNVMMAVYKPIIDSKTFVISANAGPSPIAGNLCSPYFFASSWQNDQTHSAVGKYMQDKGIKNAFLIAPNYQAGKDSIAGVQRFYKNPTAGVLYVPLNQTDFAAELSQIRAAKPDAVFSFFPGGLGVAFVKQYAQAGLIKEVPLYSAFTIDWTNLAAIGDAAVGTFHASFWAADLDNPANKKFVAAFRQKYSKEPEMYSAQGYDAALMIDAAVKAVKGKVEDHDAFRAALRKNDIASVRGPFKFNNNHFPIQNFYLREVVKGADGKLQIASRGIALKDDKDAYSGECPMKW